MDIAGRRLTGARVRRWLLDIAATAMLIVAVVSASSAQTKVIEVTDLAGRTIKVKQGAERIILGEGRLM